LDAKGRLFRLYSYLRQFFRYLGSRDELLENTNESSNTLEKLGGVHSVQGYCQFMRNAREIFEAPAIGLSLSRISQLNSMHGTLGTAIYNSATLYDCLNIMLHYGSLRAKAIPLHWVEENDFIGLEIRFLEPMGDVHPVVTEICLSILFSMIKVVSRNDIRHFTIDFDYPAPSYFKDYEQVFPVKSIRFSQATTRFLVPKLIANHGADIESDLQLRASAIERCEELL